MASQLHAAHDVNSHLGDDLGHVWNAPTTTSRDRKQLLRTLLDEVAITVHRDHAEGRADLVLRWKGGAISELTVPLRRKPPRSAPARTPSTWSAGSPCTPPVGSSHCATTGTSAATSPANRCPKESCST
ncbi:MAG TPA: hypothetical protein VMU94_00135 [Streptosporangiaceae bacterium]|nr:hypothetical protein [Streptosporangiaceae bacterium]